jgi:glutaredoxin
MSKVSYEKVVPIIPELKDKKYEVVIVGYEMCPFSKMSQSALHDLPSAKGHSVFVSVDRGSQAEDNIRTALHYSGTFPLVFVRQNGHMVHVGGGLDFVKYVASHKA